MQQSENEIVKVCLHKWYRNDEGEAHLVIMNQKVISPIGKCLPM